MFCAKCGRELQAAVRFCPYCGAKSGEAQEPPVRAAATKDIESTDDSPSVSEEAPTPTLNVEPDFSAVPQAVREMPTASAVETASFPEPPLANTVPAWDEPQKKKKRFVPWVVLGCAAAVLVAAGVLFFRWYNQPIQRFDRALKDGDYTWAGDYYSSGSIPAEDRSDVKKKVFAVLDKALSDYNNGVISLENTEALLTDLDDSFHFSETANAMIKLEKMKASKEAFQAGADYEVKGDLPTAISSYEQVTEGDSQYEDAKAKAEELRAAYKEDILEQARALAEKEDYAGAVLLLEESGSVLKADADISSLQTDYQNKADEQSVNAALSEAEKKARSEDYSAAISALNACSVTDSRITAKLAEYKKKLEDKTVADTLEKAEAIAEEKDYPQAIKLLLDARFSNSKIEAKLDEYKNTYEQQVLSEAAALAEEGKFEEAVSKLNEGVNTIGQTAELTAKIDDYKAKYPVSLLDLEPSGGDDCGSTDFYTDIYGNSANRSLAFEGIYDYSTEYVPNGKFTTFSGTFLVGKGTRDNYNSICEIYIDGNLKYSITLTKKTKPTAFSLDISNATFVKIKLQNESNKWGEALIADPIFSN